MACKKLLAEGIGTFWLVLGGCGAAVLAGSGIGTLGVSLAFGLSLLTMAYAIGPVSGCHLNPAVTIGLVIGKRFDGGDAIGYIIAQVIGATLAAYVITHIAGGHAGWDISKGLAANGFGEHSPGGYDMQAAFLTEFVMTALFVFIIMGTTEKGSFSTMAPLAIGLTLCLIHLITIPVTNTSVNPARSTGPALLMQGWALDQLWLFWVAPILGGIAGGWGYNYFHTCKNK